MQSDTWFYVGAPAGDAWLTVWGLFFADTEPRSAEDGLTSLLRLALDRLPEGASIQGPDRAVRSRSDMKYGQPQTACAVQ